jgi:two-component system chemotaxis sensor kinase CheA
LGRKGPGRRGSVDKFLMVPKEVVEDLIQRLDEAGAQSAEQKAIALQQARDALNQLGAEPLSRMLSGVTDSLPSLAQELGKAAPQVVMKDAGILVRTQLADTLRNVFMHLFRNSLDHGLERPVERTLLGKSEAGSITLSTQLSTNTLTLRLKDDGRGLALQRIKAKAIEQGLLAPTAVASAHDIAQLIFASGFSTATEVTEVSGRGVGMDAVRGFIQAESGEISLELASTDANVEFCPFETVITLPAKFAVQAS